MRFYEGMRAGQMEGCGPEEAGANKGWEGGKRGGGEVRVLLPRGQWLG
jgi:hypothetical protein